MTHPKTEINDKPKIDKHENKKYLYDNALLADVRHEFRQL